MMMTVAAAEKHRHGVVVGASLAGFLFSAATLPVHFFIDHGPSVELAAVTVAVVGAIYVGFAVQAGTVRQIVVETLVATLFMAAGLASLWVSPWFAPAAFAAHGFWDWLHHGRAHSADLIAPAAWYPPMCAAYDWVFAAGLAAIWLA